MKKKAVAINSGSLDSSLCLALAISEFGKDEVLSLSFCYNRRNTSQLQQAETISQKWGIDHTLLSIDISSMDKFRGWTLPEGIINASTIGKNGLIAHLGAVHAQSVGAQNIFMGIVDTEKQSDCTRHYMDLKQQILRMELNNPAFEIRTPLIHLTKKEILEQCHKLAILKFLLSETISCLNDIPWQGCGRCAMCQQFNTALAEFLQEHPEFSMPYALGIVNKV